MPDSPLSVDDKTFLFEAIQHLCCSLHPETAIQQFYTYIARFLPLRSFSLLSSAPPELHPGQVLCVAQVTDSGIDCPMRKVALSTESNGLAKRLGLHEVGGVTEYSVRTEKDPLYRYLNVFSKPLAAPLFVVRLMKEHVLGTAHFAEKTPFTEHHMRLMRGLEAPLCIAMGNLLQHKELEEIRSNILSDNQRLRRQLQGLESVDIIGAHHGLKQVMQKVRLVAPVDVPVLITGETGTGKEVIAKALHELSFRGRRPFVAVNCGALPPTLIDSELFGFTRGAFTGATETRKGYFERANGGTLFLDEIGELPLDAQVRLLRVLETREMEKVGGNVTVKLDIRLLAATNRDLKKMVAAGTFRDDLYFRLRVVSVALPPLRERRADIPALLQFLLQRSAARFGMALPALAEGELEKLLAHDWPGNIRELQNVLEEALVCSEGRPLRMTVTRDKIPMTASGNLRGGAVSGIESGIGSSARSEDLPPTYNEVLYEYFSGLLQLTKGRISGPQGAALKANLKPGTFRFKCSQLGVLQT